MKTNTTVDFKYNYVYYKYKQHFSNGRVIGIASRAGFLFDEDFNLTDVRYKDLPKSFIYGIYEHGVGYLDSFGVKGLKYIHGPDAEFPWSDILLVSYSEEEPTIQSYDCYVKGWEIISFLKGVYENSDYDVYPIYLKFNEHLEYYRRRHRDEISPSYNLHVTIFGFPVGYRKDRKYRGIEKMMQYEYETEQMKKEEIREQNRQYAEWNRKY